MILLGNLTFSMRYYYYFLLHICQNIRVYMYEKYKINLLKVMNFMHWYVT